MSEIVAISRTKIKPGKLKQWKKVAVKCMESARTKDSGTLQYDFFLNEKRMECIAIERFRDSEACIEHNENLGPLFQELLELCTAEGEVLGEPSAELKARLEKFGVKVFTPYQSL